MCSDVVMKRKVTISTLNILHLSPEPLPLEAAHAKPLRSPPNHERRVGVRRVVSGIGCPRIEATVRHRGGTERKVSKEEIFSLLEDLTVGLGFFLSWCRATFSHFVYLFRVDERAVKRNPESGFTRQRPCVRPCVACRVPVLRTASKICQSLSSKASVRDL